MELILAPTAATLADRGQLVFQAAIVIIAGIALAEALMMARDSWRRDQLLAEMRHALPWAAGLVLAQLGALSLAVVHPEFKMLGRLAMVYLGFAVLFPAVWAVGQVWGAAGGMPARENQWSDRRKLTVTALVAAAGMVLNVVLFALTDVQVGDQVRELTEGLSSVSVALVALWLIFNAPWLEELLLRHYLVARMAVQRPAAMHQAGAPWTAFVVVVVAALFALGHAGHMEPAWPKLLQTFTWGLMLGWARVCLGTWYAVALHLGWNLTAPLAAPFIGQA